MRYLPFALFLFLISISACKPDIQNKENQPISKEPEKQVTVLSKPDSLSSSQLEDIKIIHATFSEVYPISLNESIKNFKKDQDTNREIQIWMKMVKSFNSLTSAGNYPKIEERQEVFSVILASTMMPLEKIKADVELTELSENEVDQIVGLFLASFKNN